MKNFKQKIIFLSLFLFGSVGLSACHVPFLNKEITLPFFEKSPQKTLLLAKDKMANVKKMKYKMDLSFLLDLDLNESDVSLNFLNPKVLGESVSYLKKNNFQENQKITIPQNSFPGKTPSASNFMPKLGKAFKINLKYKVDGAVDSADADNLKNENKVDMGLDLSGTEMKLGFETKTIKDTFYGKIDKAPFPLSLILGQFFHTWYSFDPEDLKSLSSNKVDFQKNNEQSKEINKKIKNLIKKTNIFQFKERLRDEKVNNKKCYHYKVGIDKPALNKLIKDIVKILNEEYDKNDKISLKMDLNDPDLQAFLTGLTNTIIKDDIDLWIDKKDFYLRKTSFNVLFDFNKIKKIKKEKIKKINLNISGTINYFDFDGNFEIKVPENAKSIFKELEKNGMIDELKDSFDIDNAKKKARNAKRTSDLKILQTAIEIYINENNSLPNIKVAPGFDSWDGGQGSLAYALKEYLSTGLPKDPLTENPHSIVYCWDEKGNYLIANSLEKTIKPYGKDKNALGASDVKYEKCIESKNGSQVEMPVCGENGKIANKENVFVLCFGSYPESNFSNNSSKVYKKFSDLDKEIKKDDEKKYIDSDGDGLSDEDEKYYGTFIHNPDSDGDGYLDGDEVNHGYNPLGKGKLKRKR